MSTSFCARTRAEKAINESNATRLNGNELLRRNPWGMLLLARSAEYFPLTLTLSLPPSRREGGREREQEASVCSLADGRWADSSAGLIARRWTILPLPRGEGRGEGEPTVVHPTVQSLPF